MPVENCPFQDNIFSIFTQSISFKNQLKIQIFLAYEMFTRPYSCIGLIMPNFAFYLQFYHSKYTLEYLHINILTFYVPR